MTQTILAEKLTLYDLQKQFGLQRVENSQLFSEWQTDLPQLTEREQAQLDRVKANYLHLSTRPMLEETVKMVVVAPLLDLAGFYQAPFFTVTEKSVKLSARDEQITIRGKIDVLVVQEQFWILVIKSKQSGLSLEPGIPQALAYMLANPQPVKPLYGMVSNGSNFIFLKLVQQNVPTYAISDEFALRRGNDLYGVLQVLKHLAEVIAQENDD